MFWRVLKKDLKRKKTMNVILLLFVILSATFASASLNNIMAVTGGVESFFDVANVPDLYLSIPESSDMDQRVKEIPGVREVKVEHYVMIMSSKHFALNGKTLDNFINPALMLSDAEMGINYFDENDRLIREVGKGGFYATAPFTQNRKAEKGERYEVTLGDKTISLTYLGRFKGALFSNEETSSPYLIVNHEDFAEFATAGGATFGELMVKSAYVYTSDPEAVMDFVKEDERISFATRKEMKSLYLYDMLAAYILMAISILLMLTAFFVLRFTIGFTMSEEFREIGVMKAVGIKNGSIRGLYLIKYLALALVGTIIGYFLSLPLGKMMMRTVTENMVAGGANSRAIGLVGAGAVVLVILLFCYACTRKVNKLSPIDAVRSGETGEKFRKKRHLRLGRSKLPESCFMAVNDIVCAPKRFSVITIIFVLCMLMMTLLSNFAATLRSDKIYRFFGVPESDVTISDVEYFQSIFSDPSSYREVLADTEKLLEEKDLRGTCTMSFGAAYETTFNGKKSSILYWVTKGETKDPFRCDKGRAPARADEIAMTSFALKELGASIGDKVTATLGNRVFEFTITGTFSTFQGAGYAATLWRDFEVTSDMQAYSSFGVQILFDGDPSRKTVERNVRILREAIGSDKVYTTADMIKTMTGVSDTLNLIKKMMMILTAIVGGMIVVLMERSFISKEKSEIALLKAVGVGNGSIVLRHTLRFVIVALVAIALSLAVLMPLGDLMMNAICSLIGDVSGLKCDFVPLEIFAVCPAILLGVSALGAFLTALYTKTIKASDTASIE